MNMQGIQGTKQRKKYVYQNDSACQGASLHNAITCRRVTQSQGRLWAGNTALCRVQPHPNPPNLPLSCWNRATLFILR